MSNIIMCPLLRAFIVMGNPEQYLKKQTTAISYPAVFYPPSSGAGLDFMLIFMCTNCTGGTNLLYSRSL